MLPVVVQEEEQRVGTLREDVLLGEAAQQRLAPQLLLEFSVLDELAVDLLELVLRLALQFLLQIRQILLISDFAQILS